MRPSSRHSKPSRAYGSSRAPPSRRRRWALRRHRHALDRGAALGPSPRRLRRPAERHGAPRGDPAQRLGLRTNRPRHGHRARAPARGTAWQYFLPGGPLAILPLPGGHRSSIVWSESDAAAAGIQRLPDADYLGALRPRFGDFLGSIRLAGDRFTYPLSLSLAHSFVAPRVALVGDAAHGVHPIAGQGLNLGLRDVAALAEVLTLAARRGEDVGSPLVLDRYQQWRRFDATALALGMDMVNRLFSNDNPVMRAGRDLSMGIVNALPGLRRGFIRQAAGLSGDLPRLLQGRPI